MASSSDDGFLNAVAVVGMAGRFPGAGSVEELWENLKAGRESVDFFTDEELAEEGIPEELIRDPSYVKARGLLDHPETFDAAFFGISPREAELMDPQHRLFLETCWHALENAGYAPASVDVRVGVWGGMSTGMSNDTYLHSNLGGPRGVAEVDELTAMLGNENDYLTTRVSYKLNLRGPSVNVQTACSTSLVAVVQAYQSLMTWGCDMALAGGVSVSYPQKGGYLHQEGGIGSPDGHCRPFDADARGTVFSNGVGIVVLKRLEDAWEDGDRVLAVVRGAASNNDGAAKVSFAAPSVSGQAEVIASAQAIADVDPATVTYVETHGTGTPIGDPIEVEGLTRAFRRGTDEAGFCALGSIKSNFGHLDSAAGVAGFIKTVLSLHHRTLVPTVHFTTPSPRIDWDSSPFYVNAETRAWETDRLPLRAGVSAFGIGGTNAHVVLEEAPPRVHGQSDSGPRVVPLSARSPEALRAAVRRLADHLEAHPGLPLDDVAGTLQLGREAFRHRAALVASDTGEARELLAAGDPTDLVIGDADEPVDGYVFLFPGGGAQYLGMARDLHRRYPAFRQEVDRGLDLLREREGVDLRPIWFAEPDDAAANDAFQRPSVQLPALFILEMALARHLMRWGFDPAALIGHSLGENTAACLAGVVNYEDALGLVALRGRLFDDAAPGGMLSVTADPDTVRARLGPTLDLAAVNGPEQCTVSGPREAIDALAAKLDSEGIDARVVPIDIAAHSSLVEPLLEPFEAYLRSLELHPPQIPFLSNRTGTWITDDEATDPAYWAAHLRSTVRFADDVRTVLDDGHRFFLEVGPSRILSSLVKLSDPTVGPRVAATMRHPREEIADEVALLGAVGRAWTAGGDVDWRRVGGDVPLRRVALPGYPFERRPFLVAPGGAKSTRAGSGAAAPTTAGDGRGDVMARVLELQARTNAAIQALLVGQGGASPAGGGTLPNPQGDAYAPDAAGSPDEAVDHAEPVTDAAAEFVTDAAAAPDAVVGVERPKEMAPDEPARDIRAAELFVGRPCAEEGVRPALEDQRTFWEERLATPLPVLDLMADRSRTPEGLRQRAVVMRDLAPEAIQALLGAAGAEEVDPMEVALAVTVAVLHMSTGQNEIVLGIPRLPLRLGLDPAASFLTLVRTVRDRVREARAHGDVPLEALLGMLELPEDPTRAPLAQARFTWGESTSPGGSTDLPPDLAFRFAPAGDAVRLSVDFAAGLYAPGTAEDLLHHVEALLVAVADAPETHLAELPRAAPGTMERMETWQGSSEPLPHTDLVTWLCEVWSEAGARVAVADGDDEVTYADLDARSSRLANHLIEFGVRPGALVGICLERTAELVIAAIAIWKAGAGYVPLDPTLPPARLSVMSERADLDALITVASFADRIAPDVGIQVLLDRDRDAIQAAPTVRPTVDADLSAPAYVLFTSGSTGEPKGVRVPARAVLQLLRTLARRPGLDASDVVLGSTTFSFDISVLELFLPLRVGGRVVLASGEDVKDGRALIRLIEAHGINVLQFTPTGWRILQSAGWEGGGVKAIAGGEPFPRDLLRWLLPRVQEVWNGYGPTEATVYTTFAHLDDGDAPIHIGPPLPGFRCYVLDPGGQRLPPGVPGELCVAGPQVADGYVSRPEETARRFGSDPFGGGRMYRTGDLVRWRRDGTLDHMGRIDQQVKLRGFRIELGEVEAVLAAEPCVRETAVVLTELNGSRELVGYAAADAEGWDERSIRERLGERLPDYMVPRFLVRLDSLPRTPSGKTDRKALPDPRTVEVHSPTGGLAAPETEAEVYLVEVWKEILEVSGISVEDNFFDLGGHSLLAVRTIARVREEWGASIPLRALMTGTLRLVAREYLSGGGDPTTPDTPEDPGTVSRVLGTMKDWMSR
jgi:amino acid adenylation domain-containing protein